MPDPANASGNRGLDQKTEAENNRGFAWKAVAGSFDFCSNELFEELERWNIELKREKVRFDDRGPKCPAPSGQMALSAYIKAAVFSDAAPVRERNRVMADQVLLARMLGFLGTSGIAQNLRRLVADAASGSLLVDEAVAADLRSANRNTQAIYRLLLTALGKKPTDESATEQSLSETFLSAAMGVEDRYDP